MKRNLLSVLALSFLGLGLSGPVLSQDGSFSNSTIDKYAQVLAGYSLALEPGEKLLIRTNPDAEELVRAVYREAIRIGAHVHVDCEFPWQEELLLQMAGDEQLRFLQPVRLFMFEDFDAILRIESPANTKALSGIDPARIRTSRAAVRGEEMKTAIKRISEGQLKWCYTLFPTEALAQEAGMSFSSFQDFVFRACKLHLPDPVDGWRKLANRQEELAKWLRGKSKVKLRGPDIDMTLSIEDRKFIARDFTMNFPSGEIYTSPVENSANGWVRFSYPAIYQGHEVDDVRLWFEDGRVVREEAAKGKEFLTKFLDTDPGARVLGELGIGTNYDITRFVKHMLFDEKMGGTIHLAVGAGFPGAGGKNESAIHWDMLCDMSEGEIIVDGVVFYRNGEFARVSD